MARHNIRDSFGRFTASKKKDLISYDLFILDASSSMNYVKNETISGFNEVIVGIRKVSVKNKIDSRCSLLTFSSNNSETFVSKNVSIDKFKDLTPDSYFMYGMTALYDAIGKGIEFLDKTTTKGSNVTIHIFTDGRENDSRKYNRKKIASLIQNRKDKLNWTITFIGAGDKKYVLDAATSIGIFKSNVLNYDAGKEGTTKAFHTMATNTVRTRSKYALTGTVTNDGFFSSED